MHCCVNIFCACSIHWHIVIWVDGAGPQCGFHFLLITQRKPMTSLARGAESGFLINQNDFFFPGCHGRIMLSSQGELTTGRNRTNATKWGRSRRLRLVCLWAAVFACRDTTGLRYITAVTPEDSSESKRQEKVGSFLFTAVYAAAGLIVGWGELKIKKFCVPKDA